MLIRYLVSPYNDILSVSVRVRFLSKLRQPCVENTDVEHTKQLHDKKTMCLKFGSTVVDCVLCGL